MNQKKQGHSDFQPSGLGKWGAGTFRGGLYKRFERGGIQGTKALESLSLPPSLQDKSFVNMCICGGWAGLLGELFSHPPIFDQLNLEPREAERLRLDQPGVEVLPPDPPRQWEHPEPGSSARGSPFLPGSLVFVGWAPLQCWAESMSLVHLGDRGACLPLPSGYSKPTTQEAQRPSRMCPHCHRPASTPQHGPTTSTQGFLPAP